MAKRGKRKRTARANYKERGGGLGYMIYKIVKGMGQRKGGKKRGGGPINNKGEGGGCRLST